MGFLSIIHRKLRINIWIIVLSLLFFPISLVTYYFPDLNTVLFKNTSLLEIIIYPFVKIVLLLALIRYIQLSKKKHV